MSDYALVGLFLKNRDTFDKYSSTVPEHLLEAESRVVIEDRPFPAGVVQHFRVMQACRALGI